MIIDYDIYSMNDERNTDTLSSSYEPIVKKM